MAVFTGRRLYDNNVQGTTTDNPLTNVATTLNSAGLANLSAVSSNHAVIVLDPLRTAGAPEIVIVTAHTGAATSATISRGAYGTAARQHASGTLWVHPVTKDDLIQVLTSSTRPSDQYEGQLIYETDTNRLALFGGTDWAYVDAGGTLGYVERTSGQTGITANADLTGLSVAVTVGTGRRVKITGSIGVGVSNTDTTARLLIQESTTVLQRRDTKPDVTDGTSNLIELSAMTVETPSAGAHTYKLTLERVAGTGNVQTGAASTHPCFLLVEDIGAA